MLRSVLGASLRRLTHLALLLAAVVVTVAAAPAVAVAQRDLDIERFVPSLDADSFLGIQGSRTPTPGEWNTALWVHYSRRPLLLQVGDGEQPLVEDRIAGEAQFQLGIQGRLAVAVAVPVILYQNTDASLLGPDEAPIGAQAFGDPRLVARVRILGESSSVQRERHEGPGVALQLTSHLPLGQDDAYAGEGALRIGLQALADFHILGAGAGAMLGFRHRFGDPLPAIGAVEFGSELEGGIALKVPTVIIPEVFGILELRMITDVAQLFDAPRTVAETDLGFRAFLGDVTLTLGGGIGLTPGVGTPTARVLGAFSWAPRVADSDRDGIFDDRDECDHLPEDFDGFEDTDGCLDPDDDGDLIPDADDRCPRIAAEEDRDDDEDGCTDAFVDGDRDEIEDRADGCPAQAEDRDQFQDEDGCPDPDDDGDGIPDPQDRCTREAEDRDLFQDEDGCPEPDNDGDLVADENDACDDAPEDVDQVEDGDGCPDPDNDHDGVLDAADRCPGELETINGVTDDDGCPDTGGRALWRVPAAPEAPITGTIRVQQGQIPPAAAPALDQLARILIARFPARFRLTVGTGAEGAIRDALVARGVAADRLDFQTDATARNRVTLTPIALPAPPTPPPPPVEAPAPPAPAATPTPAP